MFVAGVDEAGRGPVIGPMVLCAYAIEEERQQELYNLGARDSKVLSPSQREKLAEKFSKTGEFVLKVLSAAEITGLMRKKVSLNDIEARFISEALKELSKKARISKVFVDSPDPVASKFEKRIRRYFDHAFEIICEHKADARYPAVSAASILAKVRRDEEIEKIKLRLKKEGFEDWDIGSGYPHDEKTVSFLKRHHSDARAQEFIRHEWETAKRLKVAQLDLRTYI